MKRDDRSLFGFYQGDGELSAEWEQVLSEQALGQRPDPLAANAVLSAGCAPTLPPERSRP